MTTTTKTDHRPLQLVTPTKTTLHYSLHTNVYQTTPTHHSPSSLTTTPTTTKLLLTHPLLRYYSLMMTTTITTTTMILLLHYYYYLTLLLHYYATRTSPHQPPNAHQTPRHQPPTPRDRDRLLRPCVPVIYMYVGAADRSPLDADEHVIGPDFRDWNLLQVDDAKLRVQTRAEFQSSTSACRPPTVDGTHDQVEAMTMATRIAHGGRSAEEVTANGLFTNPLNSLVAGMPLVSRPRTLST